VLNRPAVRGVAHNVFYISHYHGEDKDEETKSCSNAHEAQFLVALCDYLLKQGYRKRQITFLTPYSGQVNGLLGVLHRYELYPGSTTYFQGKQQTW
jgi:superfamily I DNA and/or RNA helicase